MKKRDSGRGNRVGLSSLGFTTVLIVLLALLVFSILASITFGSFGKGSLQRRCL